LPKNKTALFYIRAFRRTKRELCTLNKTAENNKAFRKNYIRHKSNNIGRKENYIRHRFSPAQRLAKQRLALSRQNHYKPLAINE